MKTNAETGTTTTDIATATEIAEVAEQGAASAPAKVAPKKDTTQKKNAPKGQKTAKKAAAKKPAKNAPKAKATSKKPAAKKEAGEPRGESKKAIIIDLLRRKQGATLAEIMKATGWQAHSVRGFIAGTLGKKMGLTVESFKNTTDERTYRLAK